MAMRSNVEQRRCGCGNIIGLRESCARCADKARARLHAERVGHREGWRSYRGDGSSLDEPLQKPTVGNRPAWIGEQSDGLPGVDKSLRNNQVYAVQLPSGRFATVQPAAGVDVQRDVVALQPPAKQPHLVEALRTANKAVRDGRLVISEAGNRWPTREEMDAMVQEYIDRRAAAEPAKHEPPPCDHPRVLGAGLCHDCGAMVSKAEMRQTESRLLAERHATEPLPYNANVADFFIGVDPGYHDTAVAVTSLRQADGTMKIVNVQQLTKHEPPPVGAEVSYEVAERHMFEAPEVRYRCVQSNFDTQFRVDGARKLLWSGAGTFWQPESSSPTVLDTLTWQRLPDGIAPVKRQREQWCVHEPPAIGEEVSWSEAKRDMMARKEARYRTKDDLPAEFAWGHDTLVFRDLRLGVWQSALIEKAPGHRWVRLA